MQMLFSYQGNPVKRRYRRPGGYTLVLAGRFPGRRGRRRFVTHKQWHRHGRLRAVRPADRDTSKTSPTNNQSKPSKRNHA